MYRASARTRWTQRVRVLCCCAGANNRAKRQALEDIAHAMTTIFDGIEMVPTDFIAALMLVHRDQKEQIKKQRNLGAQLKRVSYPCTLHSCVCCYQHKIMILHQTSHIDNL